MATIGNTVLTLADWAKRTDPTGKTDAIVDLLSQTNEILADMLWMQGNLPVGHRVSVQTGLPTVSWRLVNSPVSPSKGRTAQIIEQTGTLEAWSEVDKKLAELGGDVQAFRMSEAVMFMEAMNQEMAQTLFYGNAGTAPEEFNGFSPRYSDLSADNAQNIIDAGGTDAADNTSVWLVCWSENSVFGVFPMGSQAGLEHNDFGEETIEGTAGIGGTRMRGYREQWVWEAGLVIRDWRYAVRICNIDVSNLVTKSSAADLTEEMIRAFHRIPGRIPGARKAWYMNRTVFEMLDIQRKDAVGSGGQLGYTVVDGISVPSFRDIPIRICDQLTLNEARVT